MIWGKFNIVESVSGFYKLFLKDFLKEGVDLFRQQKTPQKALNSASFAYLECKESKKSSTRIKKIDILASL